MPVKIRALQLKMLMKPLPSKNQTPVVKRLDNTIHQIDHHPVDNIIHLSTTIWQGTDIMGDVSLGHSAPKSH